MTAQRTPLPLTEPSACGHCGIPRRPHAQRWTAAAGWHAWQPPTDAQILARMRARRTARIEPGDRTTQQLEPLITLTVDAGPVMAAFAAARQALAAFYTPEGTS